jgi:hypothetical protein
MKNERRIKKYNINHDLSKKLKPYQVTNTINIQPKHTQIPLAFCLLLAIVHASHVA